MRRLLLRLYPRAWRRRYGAEMSDMLEHTTLNLRVVTDLIAGAIDANLNPQLLPTVGDVSEGGTMKARIFQCAASPFSARDTWRSAAWMVGGSLVLTVLAIVLKARIGPNDFSEGLLYAAFPASLMLSNECTYFKRYSGAARLTMSLGGALLIILMMWASVAIGNRI